MFSLAVRKIRLRRGGLPGLRGASDGSRRSISANLGEKMLAQLDARNVRYCRRVGLLAQIVIAPQQEILVGNWLNGLSAD